MRKAFAKRLTGAALALGMSLSLLALPVFAMQEEISRGTAITFRPGMEGSAFTQEYLDYLADYSMDMTVSEATGSVTILADPQGPELSAPGLEDVIVGDERYAVVDTAPDFDPSPAFSADYVVQYALCPADRAMAYTVLFLERETGAEVAPAQRGIASAETTLTVHAPTVKHFKAEKESDTLTITPNGKNELILYYENVPIVRHWNRYLPGETIYRYNDIVIQVGAAQAPASGSAQPSGTGGKVIDQGGKTAGGEKIPQTGGEVKGAGPETVTVPAAPLQAAPAAEEGGFSPLLAVGIGLVLILLAAAFFLGHKKNGVSGR